MAANMKAIRDVLNEEGIACSRIDEIMNRIEQAVDRPDHVEPEIEYLELPNGDRVIVGEIVYMDNCCNYVVTKLRPLTGWFTSDKTDNARPLSGKFGESRPHETFREKIVLINTTDTAEEVLSVSPSCGCTAVKNIKSIPAHSSVDLEFTLLAPETIGPYQHHINIRTTRKEFEVYMRGVIREYFPAAVVVPVYPAGYPATPKSLQFAAPGGLTTVSITSDQPWLSATLTRTGADLRLNTVPAATETATLTLTLSDGSTSTSHITTEVQSLLTANPTAFTIVRRPDARPRVIRIGNITKDLPTVIKAATVKGSLAREDAIRVDGATVVVTLKELTQAAPIVKTVIRVVADVGDYKDQVVEIPVVVVSGR